MSEKVKYVPKYNFRSNLVCLKHVEKKLERIVILTSPELAQRAAKELLEEVQAHLHRGGILARYDTV